MPSKKKDNKELSISSKAYTKILNGEKLSIFDEKELVTQVTQHHTDSENMVSALRSDWDEKEELLLGVVNDELSGTTKSQVFDPQLATQVFERASRVMFNNPRGKSVPLSKGDIGKNMLMDLILRYCYKNANSYQSMLIKYRMIDYLSLVYGSFFAIVPWVINTDTNYIGPDLYLTRIRDCFPQPGKDTPTSSDWFGHYSLTPLANIEKLKGVYNLDELKDELRKNGGDQRESTRQSKIENERYGTQPAPDKVFPNVDAYTEYRKDVWITVSLKHNKLIRAIPNTNGNNKLPVVMKSAFPLQDTMFGLAEFERGKKLQKAINSLHNLYLDSVKASIAPIIKVKRGGVRRSTMKWGFGEMWEMDDPNNAVPLEINPIGLNVYQSTYGVLSSALANQSGTTNVQIPGEVSRNLGETATGVKFVAQRQSARDNWDQILMEDTIRQVTCRFQELIVNKMERPFMVEVYKDEIEDIYKRFPDVIEIFGDSYRANVSKEMIKPSKSSEGVYYDYDVETGSTVKPELENDVSNLNTLLSIVTKSPQVVESLARKGKEIDVAELLMRITEKSGIKDPEKLIVDLDMSQQQPMGPQGMQQPQMQPQGMQPQMQQPQFNDPDIQRIAMEALGGINGIPAR